MKLTASGAFDALSTVAPKRRAVLRMVVAGIDVDESFGPELQYLMNKGWIVKRDQPVIEAGEHAYDAVQPVLTAMVMLEPALALFAIVDAQAAAMSLMVQARRGRQ